MKATLREAIDNFDLEGWLSSFGPDEGLKEWVLDCPKCGRRNLTVNLEKRVWHCWTCERTRVDWKGQRRAVSGAGGLLSLVQLLGHHDRDQAINQIMDGTIVGYCDLYDLPSADLQAKTQGAAKPARTIAMPEGWEPITAVNAFMWARQITMVDVAAYGLGWCSTGQYAGRLIFPVWEDRRLVYFQARAGWLPRPGEKYLKSLNPSAVSGEAVSSDVLMNLDLARYYPRVTIVEGPTDLVRVGPDAVCTFGKRITTTQIGKLLQAGVTAVDLLWDSDAQAEMLVAAPLLSDLFDTRLIFLPSGDPGGHSRSFLTSLRSQAAPVDCTSSLMEI